MPCDSLPTTLEITAEDGPREATVGIVEAIAKFDEVVAQIELFEGGGVLSAVRLINPFLDLWSAAQSIDGRVSLPIESFLTALLTRTIVSPAEVNSVIAQARSAMIDFEALARSLAEVPLPAG